MVHPVLGKVNIPELTSKLVVVFLSTFPAGWI
jgi:hypothetical protein